MNKATSWSILLAVFFFAPNLWAQNFVVVKSNSKFFQTVSSVKPFLHAKNEKGYLRLELIEEKAKRVRLKIASENPRCYDTTRNFGSELNLWLNRRDLEKVTIEPLSWKFKDGSKVELASGMVVKKGEIITRDSSLRLKIPKVKMGYSFQKKYLNDEPVLISWEAKKPLFKSLASKRGLRFNSNKYFRKKRFKVQKDRRV